MIQIIVLDKGISIGGNNYPDNSLSFKVKNTSDIEIKDSSGRVLYSTPYTNFIDSDNEVYASAEAVITELKASFA